MKKENVFTYNEKLPSTLKKHLRDYENAPQRKQGAVISLLKEAKKPITLDSFIIGYYNKYGRILNRSMAYSYLHPYVKSGRVLREERELKGGKSTAFFSLPIEKPIKQAPKPKIKVSTLQEESVGEGLGMKTLRKHFSNAAKISHSVKENAIGVN